MYSEINVAIYLQLQTTYEAADGSKLCIAARPFYLPHLVRHVLIAICTCVLLNSIDALVSCFMTIIEAALVSSVYKKVFQTLSLKHLFRVPMGPEKS